jgi:hypothetical protein
MENGSSVNKNHDFILGAVVGITLFAAGTLFGVLIRNLINPLVKHKHAKKNNLCDADKAKLFIMNVVSNKIVTEENSPLQSSLYFDITTSSNNSIYRHQPHTFLSKNVASLPEKTLFKPMDEPDPFSTLSRFRR